MKSGCLLLSALSLVVPLTGCGPAELPYTDNSQDPLAYARDIKALVAQAARQAKTSQEPIDYLAPVLVELKQTDRPLGQSRRVYEELRSRLEQLIRDCQRAGGRRRIWPGNWTSWSSCADFARWSAPHADRGLIVPRTDFFARRSRNRFLASQETTDYMARPSRNQ